MLHLQALCCIHTCIWSHIERCSTRPKPSSLRSLSVSVLCGRNMIEQCIENVNDILFSNILLHANHLHFISSHFLNILFYLFHSLIFSPFETFLISSPIFSNRFFSSPSSRCPSHNLFAIRLKKSFSPAVQAAAKVITIASATTTEHMPIRDKIENVAVASTHEWTTESAV